MDRKVVLISSEVKHHHTEGYHGEYEHTDCNCEFTHEQSVIPWEEAVNTDWFKQLVKESGYYSKDEIYSPPLSHLNKFAYKYKGYSGASYSSFTDNINELMNWNEIDGVYQEVVGPERIKALSQWQKKRENFLKKEELRKKQDTIKRELMKKKREEKKLAKAKKLLEESGTYYDH